MPIFLLSKNYLLNLRAYSVVNGEVKLLNLVRLALGDLDRNVAKLCQHAAALSGH